MIDLTQLEHPGQEFRLALQISNEEPTFYDNPADFKAAFELTAGIGWVRIWRDLFDGTQQIKGRYWR